MQFAAADPVRRQPSYDNPILFKFLRETRSGVNGLVGYDINAATEETRELIFKTCMRQE